MTMTKQTKTRRNPREITKILVDYVRKVERGTLNQEDYCRKNGVTNGNIWQWKQKYIDWARMIVEGDMSLSDVPTNSKEAHRMRTSENATKTDDVDANAVENVLALHTNTLPDGVNPDSQEDITALDVEKLVRRANEASDLLFQNEKLTEQLGEAQADVGRHKNRVQKLLTYLGMMSEAEIDRNLESN